MIGNLRPASDAEIDRLLHDPESVTRFLYGGESNGRERVDLGTTWHAIHYVLTGSRLGGDEPLNFLVDEGTPVGDVDVGFGPARVLRSAQVRAIAQALVPMSGEEFGTRVSMAALDAASIYPGGWQRNGTGDSIASGYAALRTLVLRAADAGLGLVLYIN